MQGMQLETLSELKSCLQILLLKEIIGECSFVNTHFSVINPADHKGGSQKLSSRTLSFLVEVKGHLGSVCHSRSSTQNHGACDIAQNGKPQ